MSTQTAAPFKGAASFVKWSPWMGVTFAVTLLVVVPMGVIYSSWLQDTGSAWPHLKQSVLPLVLLNTAQLVLGVAIATLLLGTSLAWLVTQYEFPGRNLFQWFLLLPLAMPTYVMGFVWIGLLDFSSPLAGILRESGIHIPQIRSLGGVIFVMSFALYPYVYLLSRNAFQSMSRNVMDAASTIGMNSFHKFTQIGIPMARPWIVGGLMLVIMETLADFGTVAVFNYDTFTTAIYKTWFGLFSITGAAQLSSILVTFVLVFVLFENYFRGYRGYSVSTQGAVLMKPKKIEGPAAWSASAACLVVLMVGFLIPVVQLFAWAFNRFQADLDERYFSLLWHTLLLGLIAAGLITFFAILLGYSARVSKNPSVKWMTKIATMGYALPGTILAVGIFMSMVWLDQRIVNLFSTVFHAKIGKILTGSIAAMILAYFVRYLAVGFAPVESAMQRMTKSVEDAARVFGYRGLELIGKIHLPVIRRSVITAFILVLVDVMKEMPITLMTRPFGWDTFAVRIYEMTSEGEWERAALPSVLLVFAGMIPLFFLTRKGSEA